MTTLTPRGTAPDQGSVSTEMAIFVVPFMILLAMFLIFCGRSASAVIDVESAAASAARAAADAPTPAVAVNAANRAVADTTAGTAWRCTAATDTRDHHRGGQVTVTVICRVPLSDLGLPVATTRTVSGTARQPIDTFRADP